MNFYSYLRSLSMIVRFNVSKKKTPSPVGKLVVALGANCREKVSFGSRRTASILKVNTTSSGGSGAADNAVTCVVLSV